MHLIGRPKSQLWSARWFKIKFTHLAILRTKNFTDAYSRSRNGMHGVHLTFLCSAFGGLRCCSSSLAHTKGALSAAPNMPPFVQNNALVDPREHHTPPPTISFDFSGSYTIVDSISPPRKQCINISSENKSNDCSAAFGQRRHILLPGPSLILCSLFCYKRPQCKRSTKYFRVISDGRRFFFVAASFFISLLLLFWIV